MTKEKRNFCLQQTTRGIKKEKPSQSVIQNGVKNLFFAYIWQ